jgi:uncharacterized protein (DUF433 family)
VIALRTFVYLREGFSLQKVRDAIGRLPLEDTIHISQYRLGLAGDTIVWIDENDERFGMDLLVSPRAGRIVAVMSEVVRPFTNVQREKVVDLFRPRPRLAVNPEVRGGYPVIAGTRIPFDQISTLVEDGVPPEEIRQFYPGVTKAAARDAQTFAAYVERLKAAS